MDFVTIRNNIKNGSLMYYLRCDENNKLFNFFKDNKEIYPYKESIPEKNIHFIWIGSEIPIKYIHNINTYITNNSHYNIYLWVSHDTTIDNVIVKNISEIDLMNANIYNLAGNYGSKADILRYEIVYNYGGIYCDIDSVSMRMFDKHIENTVSYIDCGWNNLTNAFFCFSKHNTFLLYCIKCLPFAMEFKLPEHLLTGPTFMTTCFYFYNNSNINLIHQSKVIYKSIDGYTYHTNDANWRFKVSVIIPTYNRFKYLMNTINSIKKQTYKNIEIIVVNDKSTQKEYYDKKWEDIQIIHLDKGSREIFGYVSAGYVRNKGIDKASGEYIAFCDDDDIWFPNKLELQIKLMKQHNINFSCTEGYIGRGLFNKDNHYKRYNTEEYFKLLQNIFRNKNKKYLENGFPDVWNLDFQKTHNCCITSSVIVKKTLLNKIGNFKHICNGQEDKNCWIACLEYTNCLFLKDPLIYYDAGHGDGKNY